jgi:hypothetical protein
MASLTWHRKGHRVRYRIYYPDGTSRVEAVERTRQREATLLLGQAEKLESLTLQNALTPEVAIPFVHLGLLTDDDLARWFPRRPSPLHYDREALLEAYRAH